MDGELSKTDTVPQYTTHSRHITRHYRVSKTIMCLVQLQYELDYDVIANSRRQSPDVYRVFPCTHVYCVVITK